MFRGKGSRFRVQGLRFKVSGLGFRVQRVEGLGFGYIGIMANIIIG